MSTPVGSSQWMYSTPSGFYPYSIDQSLRFNNDDSAYLTRSIVSDGNKKTWTWSAWVKRGNLERGFLFSDSKASANTELEFLNTNGILYAQVYDGSGSKYKYTDIVFRDVGAWYHIVWTVDTTQATASDRNRVYINGEQITDWDVELHPNLNSDTTINVTGINHNIGAYQSGSNSFDGYMAEVNFIDGTALDPTSFGETINGIWVPKAYDTADGAYGTNGFYLSFADSSAIGDDLSGNTNDWTANNLAASDVVPDSPTNNWCVLNSVNKSSNPVYSEGNLKVSTSSTVEAVCPATFGVSSGKWYFEYVHLSSDATVVGIVTQDVPLTAWAPSSGTEWAALNAIGQFQSNTGTTPSNTSAFSNGDIIGAAIDLDANEVEFFVNGSSVGTITGITSDVLYFPFIGDRGTLSGRDLDGVLNFGQDSTFAGNTTAGGNADANGIGDFKYSVPSGFLALASANLPEPTISPNAEAQADDYFNTVLYTGNGSTQSITGVGFQPDWVWIKARSTPRKHALTDSVRGTSARLVSNTSDAEETGITNGLTSFDADGFSVDIKFDYNQSGTNFVSWNWLAGGTAVSNTDGSITSSVSAAPDAGFSIVSYTGTGANATVGHGLSSAPEMLIIKNRDTARVWVVYHEYNTSAPETDWLRLNDINATDDEVLIWNDTAPTSSVFSIGASVGVNESGDNFIAYCFHSVDGFSKVGSYVGNGSADGTFVYTGFRPAWFIIKRTDSTSNWQIHDTIRNPINPMDVFLRANTADDEIGPSTSYHFDVLSNGFKIRNTSAAWNASGGSYIYLAIGSSFKYANAR